MNRVTYCVSFSSFIYSHNLRETTQSFVLYEETNRNVDGYIEKSTRSTKFETNLLHISCGRSRIEDSINQVTS